LKAGLLLPFILGPSAFSTPGSSQTVERIFDPYALAAATTIYPGETGLGATDLADLIQWYVPGAIVARTWNGDIAVSLRGGHTSLTGSGQTGSGPPPGARIPGTPGSGQGGGSPPSPPGNPLLIVDGYKVSNKDFSWRLRSLSPFRVERMVVLRDLASTAIYGIRGARGVILVYTRRR
jgi:TonB-dependent SusC/RagA subfamily outer membrane receptor